ncbi:MAG: hypothetical protein HY343_13545 [Lentisphaerae bacterium]|nr:hypothetical protein [Lentisphaerota bacterium]
MLRELPVPEAGQLVFFGNARPEGTTDFLANGRAFSYLFLREFQKKNDIFSAVAAVDSRLFTTHGRVASSAEMERFDVELVSGSYFRTLGAGASLGRTLVNSDDQVPGSHAVAVASHAWWLRRFGGNPSAVGETMYPAGGNSDRSRWWISTLSVRRTSMS